MKSIKKPWFRLLKHSIDDPENHTHVSPPEEYGYIITRIQQDQYCNQNKTKHKKIWDMLPMLQHVDLSMYFFLVSFWFLHRALCKWLSVLINDMGHDILKSHIVISYAHDNTRKKRHQNFPKVTQMERSNVIRVIYYSYKRIILGMG